MIRGSNSSRGMRYFSSPKCQDWIWSPPPSIHSVPGFFPGGKMMGMKLTSHLNLVSSLRMYRTISLLPLFAFMALTKTTLPWPVYQTTWCHIPQDSDPYRTRRKVNLWRTSHVMLRNNSLLNIMKK